MAGEPTETFDRLHAGLAEKVGPLFQPPGDADDDLSGRLIGQYKLLQRLGSGGFGDVYVAEQQEPIQRRVALKLIKLGMDTRQVIARFEAERQALALMDHPNIAKVLDAAATETGRPYFVMELVEGEPITAYCDRERLTIAERLDVFAQVCRALQHAHQKAVLHRDIKPSNVLVSTVDRRPLVKVIDFGIAKATGRNLTDQTLFTAFHQMIGTPEYMSPEQAEGSPDIDTRTDVYSLGVMLYELLTGTTPVSSAELRQVSLGELQRILRELDPPRPSTRASRSDTLCTVAANRGVDPRRLAPLISGELDWIVMKCLSKERSRRYESADALAADIARYRAGEPVIAAPPSAAYLVRKFLRRHRVAAGSVALVALALVVGLGAALYGLRSALRARDVETAAKRSAEQDRLAAVQSEQRAQQEAAGSRATLQFVEQMFSAIDPVLARGHDVTVAEMLDPAAEKVAQAFAGRPDAEALVRGVMGQAYRQVARYEPAARELARAWELYRTRNAPLDADALAVLHNYGVAVLQSGDVPRARELLQDALERRNAMFGATHRDTLATRSVLALARQLAGDMAGATTDIRTVIADQERALGRADVDTLESLCSLADLQEAAGQSVDALATAHDAAERATAAHGPEHPLALMARSIEAEALVSLDRDADAATLLEQVVRSKERLYGEAHPQTLVSADILARTLAHIGKEDEALALARVVVERATRALGQRHASTLTYMNNLAQALRRIGRLDEAEPLFRQILALRREVNGAQNQETLIVMSNLALLLMQRGNPTDAYPLLRDALDGLRSQLPADNWMLGVAQVNLGRCQTALGRLSESEATLIAAHTLLQQTLGPGHARTLAARAALAELYDALGKPDEARTWRESPH